MSLQAYIKALFTSNSNYLSPEQAFNQAASLQTLSEDLYTDPCRFVYELIQNADDASGTNLRIASIDNYLIVSHDGTPFDKKDVHSICSVNSSTKIRNTRTTGYKGLGFKAVFGKSNYVLIMTKDECFRFDIEYEFKWQWDGDQKSWERNNDRKFIYPWQICPIWTKTEDIPAPVKIWLTNRKNKMQVDIIIRLYNVNETYDALQELKKQPYTFLFLRHLRRLEFLDKSGPSTIIREKEQNGIIKLSDDKDQPSQWLISHRMVSIPSDIRSDRRLPEKLHQMSSIEIGLAARLDPNNPKKFRRMSTDTDDNVLFAYMPTKISEYNLSLITNVNCLTNANREQIHIDSVWNQWLFERIPIVTMEWIKELSKQGHWNDAVYDLLPRPNKNNDIISKKYNQGCSTAFATIKFIRNTQGNYLNIHEAIIDSTQLSTEDFIGTEPICRFILREYRPPQNLTCHPFVLDHPVLRELSVRAFDWKNAIAMFHSEEFQRNFSIDRNIKFIAYLFNKRTDENISRLLHTLPFLMDRKGKLQIPTRILFPSQFCDPKWSSPDCPDAYMHDDLVNKLPSEHRQWLEQLGVAVKTDLTVFYHTILPYSQTFITFDNALFTIRRLFYLHINGQIPFDHLRKLTELSLLTNTNTLVPANRLYLSSAYQPRLSLDAELSMMPQLFVSPSYMLDFFPGPEEWKFFFSLLGVHDNIGLTILNTSNCKNFLIYNDDQRRIIFNINSQQIRGYRHFKTIQFLELTEDNFQFASFFWKHVIKTIKIEELIESEIAYWGVLGKPGATNGSEVNTFPQWFIRMRSCIPVQLELKDGTIDKKCFKGSDVYSDALSALTSRYLPTFECPPGEPSLNEKWIKFFRFKTELPIDDHFYILHRISTRNQTTINSDDEKRIQNIYASLLQMLCKTTPQQRTLYREKCQSMSIYFLNEHNDFMLPEQLSVCLIDPFKPATDCYTLKLRPENRRHSNLSNLLEVFNLGKFEEKDFNVKPVNEHICSELIDRLRKSHFSALLNHHKIKNIDQLNQLENIQYIEADRLELYTINENRLLGTTSFYFHNHTFFVQSPWNSNTIIDCLTKRVCDLLKIPLQLFQTHINTLLTTDSIEDYFIQLGINPLSDDLSKVTNPTILEDPQVSDALPQLLLTNLENQRPRWTGRIYHYTHLENAVSILNDRALKSRHLCSENSSKDSSSSSLTAERDDQMNHYVHFYFRTLTHSQRINENLGSETSKKHNKYKPMCPVPIFFSIDLRAVLNLPNLRWKISLGDMSEARTEHGCTPEIIQRLNFSDLFAESGTGNAQSEFLIEDQLDLRELPEDAITLIYQNADAQQSLELLVEETKRNFRSEVSPKNYFISNPRVYINHDDTQDHISIHIDGENQRVDGIFIVQIKSDNKDEKIDLACKGNICAVFHHQHTTTIYGRQPSFDVFVARRNYAVYYRYEDRHWLIYTNHNQPELDRSHDDQYSHFIP